MKIQYDESLPITAWHDEIAAAIAGNPVLILAGETGSGKTTQLPKICLELGRGSIAHTQPRRLAARTVAERIAEELEVEIGDVVGYQVRFTRKAGRATRLKVMTDGVLLAEIGRDRDLRRYDTIIVDEAHERSLNIDFLLGYLKQLLTRRDDLKVIITSATIDTERFAAHFAGPNGSPAPIIEVSGRTYPVEIRYRPLLRAEGAPNRSDGEKDQVTGIVDAVGELSALGNGDILVFLSGEREIRDTAEALGGANLRFTEILPLYARLSSAEQHRVFVPRGEDKPNSIGNMGRRRIVLATNVAETSLTVPGIRYVIDTGTARISRYSARTKVQRLPIEPISQASANQRAGRCGRVAPGVAIRLYDEEDFLSRPEFTEPEILRTNLASVILQMTAAGLGEIAAFPFVEPPDRGQITDGLRLLTELGALDQRGTRDRPRLTGIGRQLAGLPVDPRMGRMLLAGDAYGCLRETLVLVSMLSIVDPRERPAEQREKADALHKRFVTDEAESDFVAILNLWDYLREQQHALSGNGFRRMCREQFLHYLRIREWQDLHGQLKQIARDLGLHRNEEPAPAAQVHTAVLSGLLSHVGLADLREDARPVRGADGKPVRKSRRPQREYLGARGTKFAINPGSSLAALQPPLVMAAEIVETSRLWARTVAAISAAQVEEVGAHLLTRQYSEPHWSSRSGSVLAYETVSLYGVPIIAGRRVGYGKIDPVAARDIFLRSALVEGRWHTRHRFFATNQALRAEAEALEERARRRDLLVDDETILAFYDARVPEGIVSAAHFDRWWRDERQRRPELLTMTMADLTTGVGTVGAEDFPTTWTVDGHDLATSYVFDPGREGDGVTVQVPVAVLNQLPAEPFTWQVPGLRPELATELVRSLPKAIRRHLVPAPDHAARALDWLADHPGGPGESLPDALARAFRMLTGELIQPGDWDLTRLPEHLRVGFEVVDAAGQPVAAGKDLPELQRRLAPQVRRTLSRAAPALTATGATSWIFGTIPEELSVRRDGHAAVGYPALVDEGATVGLALFENPERQRRSMRAGLRRLVLLGTPDPTRWVVSHLTNQAKLALGASPYPSVPDLLADARLASVGALIERHQRGPVRDAEAYARLSDLVRADNPEFMRAVVDLVAEILPLHGAAMAALEQVRRVSPTAADDLAEQLGNLVFPGFVSATPYEHLVDLPRYLRAAQARITTLLSQPARDRVGAETIADLEDAYAELVAAQPAGPLAPPVAEVGWLLEELRVSLFAQTLRTKVPVSAKRIRSAIAAARG